MKYCANCGNALDDTAVFCGNCGAQQQAAAPVAPVAPVYQAPVAPVQQGPSTGSKVLGGIGFGLSMLAFVLGFVCLIMSLVATDMGYYSMVEYCSSVIGIFFATFVFPLLGTIFCGKARKDGMGGLATTGKVFGIISIVLYSLSLFISFILLMD